MKRILRFEVLIFGAILISHIYISVSPFKGLMNWYRTDDAFYYFQTAKNISNGLGVTFDGINSTNGFHPLWMLVCIPVFSLARIDLYLPFRILIVISGILHACSAVVLYKWIARVFSKGMGMIAAIIWAFTPSIHKLTAESGLETGLSAFLIILLLSRISSLDKKNKKNHKLIGIAIIASLAFLARLDNIFLILFLGIWVVFSEIRMRNLVVLDGIFIFFTAYLSILMRLGYVIDLYTYSNGIYLFVGLTLLIKIPMNFVFRLYQPEGIPSLKVLLKNSILSAITSQFIIGIIILPMISLISWLSLPRSILVIDLLFSSFLLILSRIVSWYLKNPQYYSENSSPKALFLDTWKTWGRNFLIYYGSVGSTIIIYMLYNLLAFGTYLPVSGQIKQWWGKMLTVYGSNVNSIPEALGFSSEPWNFLISPISEIHALMSALVLEIFLLSFFSLSLVILLYINFKKLPIFMDSLLLLPILAGAFFQIWTYNLRSYVGFRDWYWVAEYLIIFLFVMILIHFFVTTISKPKVQKVVLTGLIILISIWFGSRFINRVVGLTTYSLENMKEGAYLSGVSFLEEKTAPGSIIGMTGGGTTGYFIEDRTIVNLDGLINSYEYFHALKNHQVSELLKSIDLQYVFAAPYIINESSPYLVEFPSQLTEIEEYGNYTLYYFGDPNQ